MGHDVIMGDFATLAPGVQISGFVFLGKRVFAGTGAAFVNGTKDAPIVIGAGAVVTKSIPGGVTVAGVPAKQMRR